MIISPAAFGQKGASRRRAEGQYQVSGEASITSADRGSHASGTLWRGYGPSGTLADESSRTYLAAPPVADGPTFCASHALSGRVARRKPVTRSRAAAVSSQLSTGHSFQATMAL